MPSFPVEEFPDKLGVPGVPELFEELEVIELLLLLLILLLLLLPLLLLPLPPSTLLLDLKIVLHIKLAVSLASAWHFHHTNVFIFGFLSK
ncbi:MAG: hypothetical protein MZV64_64870 [Ignavibacteriales bacterium]|nr:hypothetical protein [Ignavibacteriales bacterium]